MEVSSSVSEQWVIEGRLQVSLHRSGSGAESSTTDISSSSHWMESCSICSRRSETGNIEAECGFQLGPDNQNMRVLLVDKSCRGWDSCGDE